MAGMQPRDPFKDFYMPGESEESKEELRRNTAATATQLVQPTPSAIFTNPELIAKIDAAKKEKAEQEKQQQEQTKPKDSTGSSGSSSGKTD
ncbi:hypothetical protein BOX15_Mlig003009g2 [Macrostomum lignano]|uniref:Uncharacterized protein n=2 Tax=Macrostomum lignano TaxID=282301 RepID=A0A267FNT7_9PLAT|nr:hypothetical protein BOX15_Mlig003009g2 [Macrostomum lignano]